MNLMDMNEFDLARYSRQVRKIEAINKQCDDARLSLASWDPKANLERRLAERRAALSR